MSNVRVHEVLYAPAIDFTDSIEWRKLFPDPPYARPFATTSIACDIGSFSTQLCNVLRWKQTINNNVAILLIRSA